MTIMSKSIWIMSCNEKCYKVREAFKNSPVNYWDNKAKVNVNDIVYIYVSAPVSGVCIKTYVSEINVEFENIIDDRQFYTNEDEFFKNPQQLYFKLELLHTFNEPIKLVLLKQFGLKGAPQGPIKITSNQNVLSFLERKELNE